MTIGNRLTEWLSRLVQIPSVSPDQAGPRAGAPGEARLAAEVSHWFRKFGGEVFQEDVLPERPNIYGLWQGKSDRWIGVDVHLDTVGVEQMVGDPFDGRIDGDRVYGRGAVDTKATLAVVLALLEVMANTGQKPKANLIVVATIDEEVNARGAPAFANWIRERQLPLDQLAVAEPTQCGPVYGHKGVCRVEFQVKGKSTHTAQPELGENAITAAAEVVQALAAENERLQTLPQETAMGSPTLTVSLIQGGTGINVVPDLCRLTLDRRTVAGEKAPEVAQALHQLAREACPLPVTMESLLQLDAFYQSPETPWLKQLAKWSGQEPAVVPYATNAWAYGDIARECAVIGPGSIDQAHGDEEWVEISELEKLADIYAKWWEIKK
jgi:acetylornithine deacetylase/succinyl-diaminopimelate desuccinylase-like protein